MPGRTSRRLKVMLGSLFLLAVAAYTLVPIYWLLVASSKSTHQLFTTTTFFPASPLNWGTNLRSLLATDGGYFSSWFANSLLYSVASAALATVVSTMCGYGLAKYRYRSRRLILGVVVGSLMIPPTALVVPLFLLEHRLDLANTYQGLILPLAVYPFGVYFMSIYAAESVPDPLIESARIDGAGEFRIFRTIARPLLMPGMATLFLLAFVGAWNNYFLPLVLLSSESRFPLTVGLSSWASELNAAGGARPLYPEVLLGSLLSVLPMLILFPLLQRYIVRGLVLGSVAGE